jgi:chorismate mutase/prephenate dehydrogenase
MSAGELAKLRKELEEIDKAIVELIAKRFELSKRIGEVKQRLELHILDVIREAEVLLYWRALATKYSLPVDAVVEVVNTLLKISRYAQAKLVKPVGTSVNSICIVGYGGMAKLLAKAFANEGYKVFITGRDLEKAHATAEEVGVGFGKAEESLFKSSAILLALPPQAFWNGYVDSIATLMRGKLVMDILSSKARLFEHIEQLSERHGFKYVSAHPLFGPYTPPYGERIVLIPSRTGLDVLSLAEGLWRSIGVETIVSTLEEHEKAMAVIQVVTHFMLLSYRDFVKEMAKELEVDLNRFATATFRDVQSIIQRLEKIESVVKEIASENPYSQQIKNRFLEHITKQLAK